MRIWIHSTFQTFCKQPLVFSNACFLQHFAWKDLMAMDYYYFFFTRLQSSSLPLPAFKTHCSLPWWQQERRATAQLWGGFLHPSPATCVLYFWTLEEVKLSGKGNKNPLQHCFPGQLDSSSVLSQKTATFSMHLKEHSSSTTCLWHPLKMTNIVVRGPFFPPVQDGSMS